MPMNDFVPLNSRGQSMVELAFFLPVLLLLILGAVDVAQVLSAEQHLDQAAYVAALRLRSTPSLATTPTALAAFVKTESGLSPVSAGATYSVGGDGSDQVVVTATYRYPLLLPGVAKLLGVLGGSGTWNISVSRASVATTDPPAVTHLTGVIKVDPPSGTTVPSGLTLTCTLYQNGTHVDPQYQDCSTSSALWTALTINAGDIFTATAMQVNGITSPPSTPVTG